MRFCVGIALVIAACQPPPPAQPTQIVYVQAPAQQPTPDPMPDPAPDPATDYQAPTGTQADIAKKLDLEGQAAFGQGQYELATARFRNAVSRVPEAPYFFHLCDSLFHEGKFSEALTACHAANVSNPTADLRRKNDALTKRINDEARAQGLNVAPPPGPPPSYRPRTDGTQAQLAAKLDDEGERLVKAGRFGDASSKFREAVARVPEAKYFLHLCNSLFQEGKFSEALTSCNAVGKTDPTPDIQRKADALSKRINDEARAQGVNPSSP